MSSVIGVTKITPAEELRELLIQSAKAVLDRKISPQQANAISGLAAEVHKSIKMECVEKLMASRSYSNEYECAEKMLDGAM